MDEYLIYYSYASEDKLNYDLAQGKYTKLDEAVAIVKMFQHKEKEYLHLPDNMCQYSIYKFIDKKLTSKVYSTAEGFIQEQNNFAPLFTTDDLKLIDSVIMLSIDSLQIDTCYKLQNLKKRIEYCLIES